MKSSLFSVFIVAGAVVTVLACTTPVGAALASEGPSRLQQDELGRKLYLKNCRQCHSATGDPSAENKTKYPKIKSLNDAVFLAGLTDDSILAVMKKGAGKDMKSFRDKLSDTEMVAVLKYVRTLPKEK